MKGYFVHIEVVYEGGWIECFDTLENAEKYIESEKEEWGELAEIHIIEGECLFRERTYRDEDDKVNFYERVDYREKGE